MLHFISNVVHAESKRFPSTDGIQEIRNFPVVELLCEEKCAKFF